MATWLSKGVVLLTPSPAHAGSRLSLKPITAYAIDLSSGKCSPSDQMVLYAPGDVKKLARAQKISYPACEAKFFHPIGVDDSKGAPCYLVRPPEEHTPGP